MPTVVVDHVVVAAWAQVTILAALAVAALGALRWGRRRVSRRRWQMELSQGLDTTARAVEIVAEGSDY